MRQQVKIYKIKGNPKNPRIIKNDKFKKLVKSIQEFPEMLEKRPIVVDEDMMVLGGNMRLKASKEAGLKEVWIDIATGWSQEKKDEFIVKDNVGFGEWEWDMLANDWNSSILAEWGVDVWQNEDDKEDKDVKDISDMIGEEYRVEIELSSEREQEQVFNELTKKGYKCRILTF